MTSPAEQIKAQLDANKLTQVLFNLPAGDWAGGERGIAILPERVEEFRAGVDKAIAYAKVLGNTQVNCLAGIARVAPISANWKSPLSKTCATPRRSSRRPASAW